LKLQRGRVQNELNSLNEAASDAARSTAQQDAREARELIASVVRGLGSRPSAS